MDPDHLLAMSLQQQELQDQQQQLSSKQREVLGILQHNQAKARSVEDPQLMARARSLMPLDSWRAVAREQYELNRQLEPGTPTTAVDDLVVKSMLRWFKHDFFSWVNNAPCSTCGSSNTTETGMAEPTAAERPHAGRVELYSCTVCGEITRFPRYNSPGKLLDFRRGRCGEWAHCFLLMLRAAGYDARHVCDNADHVWNEYWSRALGRWVHVDCCENAWDTPLLYEGGWGKSLAFVLAASWHGHADVTRRYVLPTALAQLPSRRSGVADKWLTQVLTEATTRLRAHLGQPQRRALAARDVAEMLQLMTLESAPSAAAAAQAAVADLPGRQSGAEAWRQARGETGSSGAGRPAANPPTAFMQAADSTLPQLFHSAGRLTGGVSRASGEHTNGSPSQITLRLFDGSLGSKWLDFGGGGAGGSAWVEYRLLPSQDPVVISHYDVIAGEDCPERDPCDWVLEAASSTAAGSSGSSTGASSSSSSDSGWLAVHECKGHRFRRRHQLCSFEVPQEARVASRAWRLRITRTADPAAATCVQLACWNLYHTAQQCPEQQLLYLDSRMCAQLRELAAAAGVKASAGTTDTASEAATASTAEGASSSNGGPNAGSNSTDQPAAGSKASISTAQREGLATLKRILVNLTQQGADTKFFKLSNKASKVQQLLSETLLQAAVFAVGFRPVLQKPAATEVQGQLVLIADDSSTSAVHRAAGTVLKLIEGDAAAATVNGKPLSECS